MKNSLITCETRPFDSILAQFGIRDAKELSWYYSKLDDPLMRCGEWDYKNKDLLTNIIVAALEILDYTGMTDEELEWVDEILWLWYHHATSVAVVKHRDKEAAKNFVRRALEYQAHWPHHPNKITWLLHLMLHDRIEEAREWVKGIPKDHGDKQTAEEVLQEWEVVCEKL
jgi:hypothetical protein